jgi:geranylgeranyl diphosphate synthase type I
VADSATVAASGADTLDADVAAALAAFLAAKRAELTAMHPALSAVVDEIEQRCAGSPGRRPAYAYWAWRGCAPPDAPVDGPADAAVDDLAVRRALSALELLRVAAVEHADVAPEPAGPVPAIGRAILSGDLALIWSAEVLTTAGLPAETLEAIGPVWDALRTGLAAGSYLDLLRAAGGLDGGDPAESPTGWALRLGAALAGADAAALAACARIGTLLDEGADAERIRGAVAAAPLAEEAREALLALSSSGS